MKMDNKPKPAVGAATVPKKRKEKRKCNEKRKEKSRVAAQCRRSKENEIFNELGEELPLKKEEVDKLDKASVMRMIIARLKSRNMLDMFPHIKSGTENIWVSKDTPPTSPESNYENKPSKIKDSDVDQLAPTSLDGFLMILANDGCITYVTDNIKNYLGISKIEVLGNPIWDYCHQCDHDELKNALNVKITKQTPNKIKEKESCKLKTAHRDLCIRLKSVLTARGRSINIKSASYKVIHVTGHLVIDSDHDKRVLIAIARPIPHPSDIEIPLETSTFLTQHSMDMKFTYVDDKMLPLLGYKSEDLMGKSIYDFYHGGDSENLSSTFKIVISKGQSETCRYRFLGKSGGYCWIVTQATVVYDRLKPQSVVCVNYVISNLENKNEVYSLAQLEASSEKNSVKKSIVKESVEKTKADIGINHKKSCEILKRELESASVSSVVKVPTVVSSAVSSKTPLKSVTKQKSEPKSVTATVFRSTAPKAVTASVFTSLSKQQQAEQKPRVEGMNTEFSRYPTMLKEEPDDITAQLRASTGSTCYLDDDDSSFDSPSFLNFMDSHNLILSEDISSLDSSNSPNSSKYYHIDSFINYRDESSDTSSSQHILSPGAVSKSPDGSSSLPSLCSPNSLSQDELAFMANDENIDLSMRAPYISMDEQDDLPLLTADGNVMWNQYNDNIPIIQHPEINENNNNIQSNNTNKNQQIVTTPTSLTLTTPTSNSSSTTNEVNNLMENFMILHKNHIADQQQQLHPQSPPEPQLLSGIRTHPENNIENIVAQNIINSENYDKVTNLCDSMEAFENNHKYYSWRDYLQINPSDQINPPDLPTQEEKLQIPQQSIILNTAAINTTTPKTTTIHVPLIRVNSNNHQLNGDTKLMNTPQKLTAAMIRISNTPSKNLLVTTPPPNNHMSNKRHILTNRTPPTIEKKRMKNNSLDIQNSTTQLLQQLMAPTQQKMKVEYSHPNVSEQQHEKLPSNKIPGNTSTTSSNSVLKNLLISGCDISLAAELTDSENLSPSNYLKEVVFLVSQDLHQKGFEDIPPALIENDCASDSGIDDENGLSSSKSYLNFEQLDRELEQHVFYKKRQHNEIVTDEVKERIMKQQCSETLTPPNVEPPISLSPFLVNDAFLMDYQLPGQEYINSDMDNF